MSLLLRRALLVLALAGCGAPWVVVRQAVPNPLAGSTTFTVAPLDLAGEKLGEPGARLSARFAASLVKRAARRGLDVSAALQQSVPVIKARVVRVEPGHHRLVSTEPAVVRLEVQILDDAGVPLDVIRLQGDAEAGAYPDLDERLGVVGEQLGVAVADYLAARTAR